MSPGLRLRQLRSLLGLSRETFCTRHALSLNTLISLELDRLKISPKQLKKIMYAFAREGLSVQEQWILEGQGRAPVKNVEEGGVAEEHFMAHWRSLFQGNSRSVFFTLKDNAMQPFYEEGDMVGGLWSEAPYLLLGKRCIACVNGIFYLGILLYHGHHFSLAPAQMAHYPFHHLLPAQDFQVAEILWHLKKNAHYA